MPSVPAGGRTFASTERSRKREDLRMTRWVLRDRLVTVRWYMGRAGPRVGKVGKGANKFRAQIFGRCIEEGKDLDATKWTVYRRRNVDVQKDCLESYVSKRNEGDREGSQRRSVKLEPDANQCPDTGSKM